jgi:hypothetical protein
VRSIPNAVSDKFCREGPKAGGDACNGQLHFAIIPTSADLLPHCLVPSPLIAAYELLVVQVAEDAQTANGKGNWSYKNVVYGEVEKGGVFWTK